MKQALWDGVLSIVDGLTKSEPGYFSSRRAGDFSDDDSTVTCEMQMGQDDGTSLIYDITVSVKVREDSADDFWTGHSQHPDIYTLPSDANESRRVVVDGQHYSIGPGNSGGFGGRRFDIEFFDGRKVTTHDLWSQGTIPPKHRERYPDNARFAPQPERSRFTAFDNLHTEETS
ncbi:hypothetical protein CP967_31265 [Streptomyces nitrosporeus]|uniref:Uncharacterized protein n=1 Tax=Streptomyces nitrosporeus TaxID=28894 RepID=A0A5J6FIQ2_9ACTN|nr:hypothetical protein [Streptomyces nitrosporeus]QEU75851.1 hypothetical protein CP967_31265 [Streptomyces nitrosporeus]GGY88793.1 hypothetical protein GCM10010327_19400 [Streptomyces nitrosporeus]